MLIGAQDAANGDDQFVATIADARIAEMAEIGQILANLGVGEAEQVAELAGAGGFVAVANQMLQFAQIKAQPIDDRLGGRPFRCRLGRFVLGIAHVAIDATGIRWMGTTRREFRAGGGFQVVSTVEDDLAVHKRRRRAGKTAADWQRQCKPQSQTTKSVLIGQVAVCLARSGQSRRRRASRRSLVAAVGGKTAVAITVLWPSIGLIGICVWT